LWHIAGYSGYMWKRADARKDSTAIAGNGSGGRDAVNINVGGNGKNSSAGQIILNMTLVIALLVNLLLLHIILTKIKHLEPQLTKWKKVIGHTGTRSHAVIILKS